MILELYMVYSALALLFFFAALLYEKDLVGKIIIIGFAIVWMTIVSVSSFAVEQNFAINGTTTTVTLKYGSSLGLFYSGMLLLAVAFLIIYLIFLVKQTAEGKQSGTL